MATYLILNTLVMIAVGLLLGKKPTRPSRAWVITLVAILFLTALFDNIIILLGVVAYDQSKILGLHLWHAPIEDFIYSVVVVILVPAIWNDPRVQRAPRT